MEVSTAKGEKSLLLRYPTGSMQTLTKHSDFFSNKKKKYPKINMTPAKYSK